MQKWVRISGPRTDPVSDLSCSDDCRFPHVLTENGANPIHPQFPLVRAGPPRPRPQHNGVNGFGHIETKFGNMAIRDVSIYFPWGSSTCFKQIKIGTTSPEKWHGWIESLPFQ